MSNGIYVRVNGQWEEVSTTEDNVVGKIESAKNEAIDESKSYTDSKISEIPDVDLSALETKEDATAKLTEAKEYTDTQISEIPEVDLTPLETKTDAQAKLVEAKEYTDEKIGDVDLSALETKEDATAKLEEAKGYADTKTVDMETTTGAQAKVDAHANKTDNPHKVTKDQVGLGKVDNAKQMPISGGTFTGIVKAQNNANYTVAQVRNVIYMEDTGEEPSNSIGNNGDMLIIYEGGS